MCDGCTFHVEKIERDLPGSINIRITNRSSRIVQALEKRRRAYRVGKLCFEKADSSRHRGDISMGLRSMHKVEMISAVILTHNEESNISYCLESIRRISNIYVVDSGSTDKTISICEKFGARVFCHPYANHADQWRWALDNLPIVTPWIVALDADFVVTRELLDRISWEINTLSEDISGIYVRHLYNFGWGKIRFGGTKKYWLRIIRRGCARPDASDLVDFRFIVDRRVVCWREAVIEH